jgi:hypothetical protein
MEYMRRVRHVPGLLLLSLVGCQQSDPGVDDGARTAEAEGAATAQLCDASCDFILQPSPDAMRKLDGKATSVAPGSKVCLAAGSIEYVRLESLHGTAESPITVINCGGQVVIGNLQDVDNSGGLVLTGSSHVKITGTGTPGKEYGIKINVSRDQGVSITGKSTDVEVEHVEVENAKFAGIMAKTDPSCDLSANRGNFVQRNTVLHHNYIHDTSEGEGFYVGHNQYYSNVTKSSCPGTELYSHELVGVKIYANRVENTGADGIQVGCAVADVEVHDNVIVNYGKSPFRVNDQNSGIQIGEGTVGKWYNNRIRALDSSTTSGLGFSIIGQGHMEIFNNTIIRPTGGFYTNLRVQPGSEIDIQNNTVIRPREYVLRTYDADSAVLFRNNLMVVDAGLKDVWREVQPKSYTESNNQRYGDVASVSFVDPANHDYHIMSNSPARDAGANASADFTFDMDNQTRSDGAFDVGADEYVSGSCPIAFTQSFSGSSALADYVNATGPAIGQFNDISAKPNGGTFSITGGRLQMVRAGSSATDNDAGVMRWTDFGCSPSVLHVAFKLSVANWTASTFQNDAFCLDIGSFGGFIDHGSAGPLTNVFNTLCVDGKGSGKFAFDTAGTQSAQFNADGTQVAVAYFLNESGSAKSYRGPDGVVRSLGANSVAAFAGTTLLFDNVAASNGDASALTDMHLRWGHSDNGTWTLDDLVIRAALPQ